MSANGDMWAAARTRSDTADVTQLVRAWARPDLAPDVVEDPQTPPTPVPPETRETQETAGRRALSAAPVSGNSGNEGSGAPWWATDTVGWAELDARLYPPVTYVVDRLLVAGNVTLLAGAPKVGKSFLALGLAVAVATGGKALGALPVTGAGGVLVVSLDDTNPARAQRRIRAVVGRGPAPNRLTLHTGHQLGRGATAADNLCRYLERHPTRLVVVDTLEHLRSPTAPGESAYSADARFLGTLRTVTERFPATSLLALCHTRKGDGSDEDPITAVSGTHGVTGGADATLTLTGTRMAPQRVLHVVSRDDDDTRMVLTWAAGGLYVSAGDPDDPTVRMTAADAQVYRAVRDAGVPVTAADLAPALPGVGKLGNRLAALVTAGHLTKTNRGTYTVT